MASISEPSEDAKGSKGLAALVYDPQARAMFFQIALALALILFFYWIIDNTLDNLRAQDKKSGFGFLDQTGGFQILTTLGTYLLDFEAGASTYLEIFWIGVINTLVVALLGIVAATLIGFVMGVFRLSNNVVLRGFSTTYIELLRNLPLLLQLFFWYRLLIAALPGKRDEPLTMFFGAVQMDASGLWTSYPIAQEGLGTTGWAFLIGVAAAIAVAWWAKKRQEATGQQFPVLWVALGLIVLLPLVVFFATGSPVEWEEPVRGRFGFRNGVGMVLKPEMIAVWLALTLYTASFIAEIVRAGILAVPHGQTEASRALGISPSVTLRKVIIPQAMRVIIPPLTSQYLNLTKNSSLAVAIAYPDVVSVFAGTALNQVGQEIEMIFMMMMVYLFFSVATSLFMNWFNERMKLVER